MRVLVLSDLHTDVPENERVISGMSRQDHVDDVLVVAGDISHQLDILADTLAHLRTIFGAVCYLPGNHELWSTRGDGRDALQRFWAILDLCRSLDITTQPTRFARGRTAVRIVPLFSWYTRPEEGPDSLFRPKPGEGHLSEMWADDHLIQWPPLECTPTQYFLGLNRITASEGDPTITFSHFLPRADLMFPVERPLGDYSDSFNFSRVAGTTLLEGQIRQLGSRIHVYGHQHRDRCRLHDNTWYVSHCLGYPRERTGLAHSKSPRVVWEDAECVLSQ